MQQITQSQKIKLSDNFSVMCDDSEARQIHPSCDEVIDIEKAINNLGFTSESYFELLMMFEDATLIKSMQQAKEALDREDYNQLVDHVSSLQGASTYIAATNLEHACTKMKQLHEQGKTVLMIEFYQQLVESAIEFRIVSRELFNSFKRK